MERGKWVRIGRMEAGVCGDEVRSADMGTLGSGCDGGGRGALGVKVKRSLEDLRETLFRRSRGSLGWRGMRVYAASDVGSCLWADDGPGLYELDCRAEMSDREM